MAATSSAAAALPPTSKIPAASAFFYCCNSSMRSSAVPWVTSLWTRTGLSWLIQILERIETDAHRRKSSDSRCNDVISPAGISRVALLDLCSWQMIP